MAVGDKRASVRAISARCAVGDDGVLEHRRAEIVGDAAAGVEQRTNSQLRRRDSLHKP